MATPPPSTAGPRGPRQARAGPDPRGRPAHLTPPPLLARPAACRPPRRPSPSPAPPRASTTSGRDGPVQPQSGRLRPSNQTRPRPSWIPVSRSLFSKRVYFFLSPRNSQIHMPMFIMSYLCIRSSDSCVWHIKMFASESTSFHLIASFSFEFILMPEMLLEECYLS